MWLDAQIGGKKGVEFPGDLHGIKMDNQPAKCILIYYQYDSFAINLFSKFVVFQCVQALNKPKDLIR